MSTFTNPELRRRLEERERRDAAEQAALRQEVEHRERLAALEEEASRKRAHDAEVKRREDEKRKDGLLPLKTLITGMTSQEALAALNGSDNENADIRQAVTLWGKGTPDCTAAQRLLKSDPQRYRVLRQIALDLGRIG